MCLAKATLEWGVGELKGRLELRSEGKDLLESWSQTGQQAGRGGQEAPGSEREKSGRGREKAGPARL